MSILLLLLSLGAHARTVAVVVGARTLWRDSCPVEDTRPECADAARELRYADDDAWRAARLLQTVAGPGDLRVLTEVDASTAGRAFPGGDPRPPTLENTLAAVRELRGPPTGDPITVVLFIAAHGTPGQVHLADGRHDFQQLRQAVLSALGERDELVLIADACNSAHWRSGELSVKPMPYFPPVEASRGRQIEAVVDGITPEDEDISGGVFTYLTLSAWMGAADVNGDGEVSAQELQDQLFRYATAGTRAPFAPVVRAPSGEANFPLPDRPFGGTVAMDAEAPARWVVMAQEPELGPQGVALGEVFTTPEEPGEVRLPAGEYTIVRLPCVWDRARRAFIVVGDDAFRYAVTVREGESTLLSEDGEPVTLGHRGARGALGQSLDELPVMALEALPPGRARYHGGTPIWLGMQVEASTSAFRGAGHRAPMLGGAISLRKPVFEGLLQVSGQVGGLIDVGSPETSTLRMGLLALDLEALALSGPHFFTGPVLGARIGLGYLDEVDGSVRQLYLAPGADAGGRFTLTSGRLSYSASALWTPSWTRVDDEPNSDELEDQELPRWDPEVRQAKVQVGLEVTW